MRSLIYLPILLTFFISCGPAERQMTDEEKVANADSAQAVVDKAIAVHGGEKFMGSTLEFDFRKIHYSAFRDENQYTYTRTYQNDTSGHIQDTLVNSTDFVRYKDGQLLDLSETWQGRYANSINSVLYFTQLPFGLNDPAVTKKYLGEVAVDGSPYHKIRVTFQEEGGGDDFDDIYIYWIHSDSYTVDYLGYEFSVNGGGTRFREAIDRQVIEGITFQNYINYKAEDKSTPIGEHDELFNRGDLIELSRIINTDISVKAN